MTDTPPRYVPVSVACKSRHIGRTKLYELMADGKVRAILFGGKRLIDLTSIDELYAKAPSFLEERRHVAARRKRGQRASTNRAA